MKKKLNHGQTDNQLYELLEHFDIDINKIDFIDNIFNNDYELEEGNYIINIGKILSGGTHWTCFKLYKNYLFYYDSFGFRPNTIIVDFCRDNDLRLLYNIDEFQSLNEELCGLYCILFLLLDSHLFIKDKKTFNQVLDEMKYWKITP